MAYTDYLDAVQKAYIAYYGRPADPDGLIYWAGRADAAGSLAAVLSAFGNSAESTSLYSNPSDSGKIDRMYQQVLGRSADPDGLSYYVHQVEIGNMSLTTVAYNIIAGVTGNDVATVANKLAAANDFTSALDTSAERDAYTGTTAATSARSFLTAVTSDTATVTTAATNKATVISDMVSNVAVAAGQTFTLTTGIDTGTKFTGSTGNDTFTTVVNNATTPTTTLNAGDSLVGGDGTDTLSVTVQDNSAAGVSGFFTSGIENLSIQVADAAGETFDLQGVSGASTLTSLNSAGALTVNNVQSNVKTVVQGANASVAVNYANTLVSGSADTAEIELNGSATTASITVDVDGQSSGGFETVNVKSTGAASGNSTASTTVTIGDAAANTIKVLNVSGDQGARLVTTLDGAASTSATTVGTVTITNTGGVDVTMTGVGGIYVGTYVSVTGGTGNDTIRVNGLDQYSTIAGGNGTDTLSISSVATLASTAFNNVTGFEKIQMAGALTNTQNLASAGAVTDVLLSAATAGGTVSGVASGLNLQMTAGGGTNASVALNNAATSSADVLNVTVGSTATTAANLAIGTLNVSNIETVNLTSSSKEEVTAGNHTITLASDSALKTLTIAGNESVVVTSTAATLTSVDASKATSHVGMTGLTLSTTAATVTGGSGNDSLSGAAGNDSLTGNAGNDVITGGAGNDVVTGGDGSDTLISGGAGNDNMSGGAGDDRIVFAAGELTSNDTVTGGDGTNTLVFSNTLAGNALADTAFKGMTGVTTITAAANGVTATANDGANNTTGTLEMTLNTSAQAAGITTVAAQYNVTTGLTTGTNAIKATVQEGFTNALTIKIGDTAGTDSINAGATTATVTISGAADAFDAADVFVGGSNASDVISIVADTATANLSGMTGVETVNVLAGSTASNTVGLTIGAATVLTSGKSLVINASALTNDAAAFTFDGSAEVTDSTNTGRFNVTSGAGADSITGGAGNDTITAGAGADRAFGGDGADTINTEAGADYVEGGAGNDSIDGAAGNDSLYGGAGTDSLTGGEGNDTFFYYAQSESAMAGTSGSNATAFTGDTLVGFNAGDGTVAGVVDRIQVPAGITVSTIGTVTIGSASIATFQDDLSQNTNLSTALASAGNVAVITISAGTAAGTYLAVATTGGAYSSSNTLIVKMQDATNLSNITTSNFTATAALVQSSNTSMTSSATSAGDTLSVTFATPTVATDLLGGVNVVSLDTGVNISGATYSATGGSLSYTLASGGSNTMTIAQNALIGSAAGTNTVTLFDAGTATGSSVVENYTLAAGTNSFTIGSTTQNVNASATGVNTINVSGTLGAAIYSGANSNDVIAAANSTNLAAATIGADFTNLTIASGGSVTMTRAQHAAFSGTVTATGTETITLTTTGAITAATAVENYVLSGAGNAITVNNATNVTGGAGGDTIQAQDGAALTGTYTSLAAADAIDLNATGSIAGVNAGAATGAGTLDISAVALINATMTAAQHNAFTTISSNADNDTITLTTAGSVAANTGIGTYSVVGGSTLTLGTAAAALDTVVDESGSGSTTVVFGAATYTGTYTNLEAGDVARIVDTTNISAIVGIDAATVDFQSTTATVTLDAGQNGSMVIANAGTGTQTIALSEADTFTTDAAIEAYSGLAASSVTIATGHTGVNLAAAAGTNTTVLIGGQTVTGTWALGDGTDVITATTGASITGVNAGAVTTAETLNLTGAITMTAAQHGGLTITAAGGADSVTLTDAFSGTAQAAVETYTLATGTNTFTAVITGGSQTVNQGATGAGTFNATLANGGSNDLAVNLSASNAITDRVAITNTSLLQADTSVVTVSNFVVANDAIRLIDTAGTATLTDGAFQTIDLGSPAAVTGEIVEITSTNVVDLTATAADGDIESVIATALGTSESNAHRTVIVYSGANAGIYHMSDVSGGDIATTDIVVELVAIVSNVGTGNLGAINFY